ncbi:DUF2341 domain-containing protein [Methanocaldococcus sp.]
MYFSQNAIILVMLMFVVSAVFYSTINYQTKAVEDEIKIKEVSLYEKNVKNTIDRDMNKIVEDAFVNASYKIMKSRKFFPDAKVAVDYITSFIKNETNKSLKCIVGNSSNITFDVGSFDIEPTDDPLKIRVIGNIELKYIKKLHNGEIVGLKNIQIDKEVKLSRIPDPYVYLNKFYYKWEYGREIILNNFPNDDKNHTFCIILNDDNFNYNRMYNENSPTEIRIIGLNSSTGRWNVVLPYWVQTWREGNNHVSIIWVKANRKELFNGEYIYLLYNSTTPVDREDPENTFILFDNFDYFDPDKWNESGEILINNSKLTVVAGAGSSVFSKDTYGEGYELMFRANFTLLHAQGVGFFNPLNIDNGVGWDMYNTSIFGNWGWGPDLYMRVGNTKTYVPDGNKYLNKFYVYSIKWNDSAENFTIFNDSLNIEYNYSENKSIPDLYPISINALPPENKTSNTNITVDWIFLKDVNDITAIVGAENIQPITYTEEKPKTFNGVIYYGVGAYDKVYNGTYSIIGLFTNKSDYWKYPTTVGYKPLIEEN